MGSVGLSIPNISEEFAGSVVGRASRYGKQVVAQGQGLGPDVGGLMAAFPQWLQSCDACGPTQELL